MVKTYHKSIRIIYFFINEACYILKSINIAPENMVHKAI